MSSGTILARWRPPRPGDLARCRELLARRPLHHCYLISRIDRALAGEPEDGRLILLGEEELAFFGDEGNLAVGDLSPAGRETLVELVRTRFRGLGIAVSPRVEVESLARGLRDQTEPRILRPQTLYGADRSAAVPPGAALLRPRQADTPRIVKAAINLAVEDLGLPRLRLSRRRMEATVRKRIRQGRTFVLRRRGRVVFKVDLAVATDLGALVEGVYTFPEVRGQGLAREGMAGFLRMLFDEYPRVSLHVDRANAAARRAYERAGMVEAGELGLAIFKSWR
jgi:hypothetical protein